MSSCPITPLALLTFFVSPQELDFECLHSLLLPVMSADLRQYPLLFGATLLVEVPLYMLCLWLTRAAARGRASLVAVLVNVATHPFVSFGLPLILADVTQANFSTHLAIAEVFAPLVEGLLLWRLTRLSFAPAMALAVVCNLASWTIGALVLG